VVEQVGPIPTSLAGVAFWVISLLPMPQSVKYGVAFGDDTRTSLLARLRKVESHLGTMSTNVEDLEGEGDTDLELSETEDGEVVE
jgi:hypothetical protein